METKDRSVSFSSSYETDLDEETEEKTLSKCSNRLETYRRTCELLEITRDWQIEEFLSTNHLVLNDRPFSLKEIRALVSAFDKNFQSLVLHSVGLNFRSIEILCRALRKCFNLNLLDFSENQIDRPALKIFVETIENFSSLGFLSLIACGIRDSSSDLLGRLCQIESLREINLSQNFLEENSCVTIGNALTQPNSNLVYLNLSWNCIRNSACVALFRGLERNKTLREFDLSWNGVNYEGSVAIRRVLIVNKTLTDLNISNCNIDWINAKIISEGLAKNQTLKILNLAFNPLTTHGVEFLLDGLKSRSSAVSFVDLSGITIFSSSARFAEKLGQKREFRIKYDGEIPVHDVVGRQKMMKSDSMRKLLHHIDNRNWRTVDYFRVLDKRQEMSLKKEELGENLVKSGLELKKHDFINIHQRLTDEKNPLTYKNFNDLIVAQRLRDRSAKIVEQNQHRAREKRHRKILLKAVRHFPSIEIVSRREKHRDTIENLAKPRAVSAGRKL